MSKFKVGDSIRCINNTTRVGDPGLSDSFMSRRALSLTEKYIVTSLFANGHPTILKIKREGGVQIDEWMAEEAFEYWTPPEPLKVKVGDFVLLYDHRMAAFASDGSMDKYLGKIIKVTGVKTVAKREFFEFEGCDNNYLYSTSIIEEMSDEKEYENEKIKKSVDTPKDMHEIAVSIFGEDHCDLQGSNLIIHFPEITITGGGGDSSHIIKDLFVRIVFSKSGKQVNATLDGTRRTYTVKEVESGYNQSHLHSSGNFGDFGHFCLGSSQFRIVLSNITIESSKTNWELMFMSLVPYLSWESKDGGPYKNYTAIKYHNLPANSSNITQEAPNILGGTPLSCFEIGSDGIQFIKDKAEFVEFLDEVSTIKSLTPTFTKSYIDKRIKDLYEGRNRPFKFKGKEFPLTIYDDSEFHEEKKTIDKDVVDTFQTYLTNTLTNYNKNLNLTYAKSNYSDKIFRDSASFK